MSSVFEETERKYPGSASTVARNWERLIRDRTEASVPCNGCNACCRSKTLQAQVRGDELERFPDAVWNDNTNSYVLKKNDDGSCTRLVDGKCSVYADRPKSCSGYDCRFHLLAGVIPDGNDPVMQEAVLQWDVLAIKSRGDAEILAAYRLAANDGGAPSTVGDAEVKSARWREFLSPVRMHMQSMSLNECREMYRDADEEARRSVADAAAASAR